MSRPSKVIEPETILPGGSGINLISERFATDFPEPDSPTMPSVSPRSTSKLTPSTAFTVPSSVLKYVRRSLTVRRFPLTFISSCVSEARPGGPPDGQPGWGGGGQEGQHTLPNKDRLRR